MAYNKQRGFTIIELMIAITVFTIAIMLVTTGVIQLGRLYRQGTTKARLLTASREIHAQFVQDLQYAAKDLETATTAANENAICLGTTRYRVVTDINASNYGELSVDRIPRPSPCGTVANTPGSITQKPLGATTWPQNGGKAIIFKIDKSPPPLNVYSLVTRFVTGDKDLFIDDNYDKSCKSGSGKEYCTVIELKSIIVKKVYN
ncbi:MAG: prepilin-type N-terminal cleavage/methylation domain-containing protein [Candidatus Saccharibacteria bacterium]